LYRIFGLTNYGGYRFNITWQRRTPAGSLGGATYNPPGDPFSVTDILGWVEWRTPRILVECHKKIKYHPSGLTSTVLRERIVGKYGDLVPTRGDGGGCFQVEYDPYDPDGDDCGDRGDGGGTGGGGDGGGGDGGGGFTCHTEYVVIEISYDGGNTWHVYWEGEATVCVS
jgi:hypothetical protein